MLGVNDIALPLVDDKPQTARPVHPAALVPGSATAKALLSAWSGDPVIVVDSPPGGGKTLAGVTIAAHLVTRAHLNVVAAFPTKMQGTSFVDRLVAQVPPEKIIVNMYGVTEKDVPAGVRCVNFGPLPIGGSLTVRTVASLAVSPMNSDDLTTVKPFYEVLIVDEGYQVTLSDMTAAATGFPQVVVLGDPGQIGPVVTHDVSLWDGPSAPHLPAPKILKTRGGAKAFKMDGTYRLGAETVKALAPLYDFAFTSRRPARYGVLGGARLNEVEHMLLPDDDATAAKLVARRAVALAGAEVDMGDGLRQATERDVAVVVARNAQVTIVSAHIASASMPGIAVGTADRMQGGEWPFVVSLDPCYQATADDAHAKDQGRTCVMASRHMVHLTWAHDDSWRSLFSDPASAGAQVRWSLTAMPEAGGC